MINPIKCQVCNGSEIVFLGGIFPWGGAVFADECPSCRPWERNLQHIKYEHEKHTRPPLIQDPSQQGLAEIAKGGEDE